MRHKRIILITFFLVILLMAVGYSTLTTDLNVSGQAQILGEWNVLITNVEIENVSAGCDAGTPSFTNTTMNFLASLNKPGDTITYKVTIENAGTIDAILQSFVFTEGIEESPAINYTMTLPQQELNAHEKTDFLITITYDEKTEVVPDITSKRLTGTVEYIQK